MPISEYIIHFLLNLFLVLESIWYRTGVSNSTMLAGHILIKKELSGRTMRQKCLRGPKKGVKSSIIPHKTVVSTIRKGILMITRATCGPRVWDPWYRTLSFGYVRLFQLVFGYHWCLFWTFKNNRFLSIRIPICKTIKLMMNDLIAEQKEICMK